jgi:hypothetical protein
MVQTTKPRPKFRVGDFVRFPYGAYTINAQIVENRGPLGYKGRQLYRVRFQFGEEEKSHIEVTEDEMEPVPLPDRGALLQYLKAGGLVEILRTNLGDRKVSPRVWLTFPSIGTLSFTTDAERGFIGGKQVPYFALFEDKIYIGKQDQVAKFLRSFGLSAAEAVDVIRSIGTGP